MAAELLYFGLDLSFAPVLDLYTATSEVIGDRAFSAEVDIAVRLIRAYVDGMHEAGMVATGKHFPGHGTVVADSHVELRLMIGPNLKFGLMISRFLVTVLTCWMRSCPRMSAIPRLTRSVPVIQAHGCRVF